MKAKVHLALTTMSLLALSLTGCGTSQDAVKGAEVPSAAAPSRSAAAADNKKAGFDSDITNNSLAVSPDGTTAVV
ncbi:MAG: hypothetical protein ACLGH7_05290, partial [Actinomycetes bacterium]